MMQTTACNALHHVQQRCARWLLMTHDRMHEQDFHLSHEFLAVMLGVQRPTVTTVAGGLQQAGLIRYTHGRVSVLDRRGLEAASCECYAIVRAHFDRFARPGR
jgi:CRP-like cAMP-binding protein